MKNAEFFAKKAAMEREKQPDTTHNGRIKYSQIYNEGFYRDVPVESKACRAIPAVFAL